jgi:hypothetical protein
MRRPAMLSDPLPTRRAGVTGLRQHHEVNLAARGDGPATVPTLASHAMGFSTQPLSLVVLWRTPLACAVFGLCQAYVRRCAVDLCAFHTHS